MRSANKLPEDHYWTYFAAFFLAVLVTILAYHILAPIVSSPAVVQTYSGKEIFQDDCVEPRLVVTSLESDAVIGFPLLVEATVDNRDAGKCRWGVFEAQAGSMELFDATGKVVGRGLLMTAEDWMTNEPVHYSGTLNLILTPAAGLLRLVITEDNPSDDVVLKTVEIPLIFTP